MAKPRTVQMVERLRDLQVSTPDIEASAVVSLDGLIMASSLPPGVEEDRVSAMSAAMLSLGERIAGELGRGVLEQVHIKGGGGGGADSAGSQWSPAGVAASGYEAGRGGSGPDRVTRSSIPYARVLRSGAVRIWYRRVSW